MTRLARITHSVNWRYALGEVFLIVIGILVALAFADWNDRRILDEQVRSMLGELRTELRQDLETIGEALDEVLEAQKDMASLMEILATRPPYDPSMDELFGIVYGTRIIFLNSAAYETLKSAGLQSVSNDALRLQIARYYSEWYEIMYLNNEIDMEINLDLLRSYYLHHFRDLRIGQSATPIDYDAVLSDPYYSNIVQYRSFVLRANRVRSYTAATKELQQILTLLDEYLD